VDSADRKLEPAPRESARHTPESNAASVRPGPLERLVGDIGNRGAARLLSRLREGEGILRDGRVAPEVESAIAAMRGSGRSLDRTTTRRIEPALGESLGDVRVHTDERAALLARAVSARAFTVGSDIFFAPGEYRPGERDGNELIAHEVAHVVQQRGAPEAGPLTVSQPGDDLERQAEALVRGLGD
jgi:Domain of unknown function (DUF4157)